MKRLSTAGVSLLALVAATGIAVAAPSFSPDAVKGKITYYTHWTNYMANGDFDRWKAEFKKMYPNVEDVDIQGIATYAETISTRLATGDYGDVLDVSTATVPLQELPDFFLPLDDLDRMNDFYFAKQWATDGVPYAYTFGVNVEGLVYNKEAFKKAGVEAVPQTFTDLLAAAHKLKDAGIIPLITNMGSAWPITTFDGLAVAISGDPDFFTKMVDDPAPFSADKPYGKSFEVLHKFIADGLTEEDLTGDHWQDSKGWMAAGKGAMWFLGNWSINQIISEGAQIEGIDNYDPSNLGYFPLPYDDSGHYNMNSAPDYALAVSANSANPETAKAWLDFLLTQTELSQQAGFIPGYKGLEPTLPQLAEIKSYNPTIIEQQPPASAYVDATNSINFSGGHGTRDVMLADDYDKAIAELNERWAQAAARAKK